MVLVAQKLQISGTDVSQPARFHLAGAGQIGSEIEELAGRFRIGYNYAMNSQLVNIIFGMKMKQARTDANLTLVEFARQCDLSPSYVTEIEKGRKYPRADKIVKIAEVLDKDYDDLVSIRLEPPLTHLGNALSSPVLGQFPFDEFGIEMSDIVGLLTREPDKASALLDAVTEIGRQYDFQEQNFLWSALRSYQELHDNYFPDIEEAALTFSKKQGIEDGDYSIDQLKEILTERFKYQFNFERLKEDENLHIYRSVFVKAMGPHPTLLINSNLHPFQIRFLLAREIGYKHLKLLDRANTSPPDQVTSFQQVLNDFRASYFAGALLMPKSHFIQDISTFFSIEKFSAEPLLQMLKKYRVTPENLMYRFSELVPQFFGTRLHYLRVHQHGDRYQLVRQLNLNRLRVPNGLAVNEHFCRHWLVVRLLRELEEAQAAGQAYDVETPIIGVQMSDYLDQDDDFLCFGFARPLERGGITSCGIIGFRVGPELKQTLQFADDHDIPRVIINETCERCGLSEAQCRLRAAPSTVLEKNRVEASRKQALRELVAEMR